MLLYCLVYICDSNHLSSSGRVAAAFWSFTNRLGGERAYHKWQSLMGQVLHESHAIWFFRNELRILNICHVYITLLQVVPRLKLIIDSMLQDVSKNKVTLRFRQPVKLSGSQRCPAHKQYKQLLIPLPLPIKSKTLKTSKERIQQLDHSNPKIKQQFFHASKCSYTAITESKSCSDIELWCPLQVNYPGTITL